MPRRLLTLILLALACLATATACGASDEQQVNDTVKRFYRAAADGDGKEACSLLTPAARAGVRRRD
jgi:hypothetical protein